jgi:tetratricopeptide (TPR) repeat protein
MTRIATFIILFMVLFLNACTLNKHVKTKPVAPETIPLTTITTPQTFPSTTIVTPQTLYKEKQYNKALMAMLESDPKRLEDPLARKLLWRINNRLVTVQWYLQKCIVELSNGNKDKARYHIEEALKIYPGHKPSLLLKQNLNSIDVKKRHKTSKRKKIITKKIITKDLVIEDLKLADYYLTAGNTYFENGRLKMAKESWLHGLSIVPSHKAITEKLVKLLTNEGLELFGKGDIKASIEKWEEALKIKPDDPEIKGYLDKARKAQKKIQSIQ